MANSSELFAVILELSGCGGGEFIDRAYIEPWFLFDFEFRQDYKEEKQRLRYHRTLDAFACNSPKVRGGKAFNLADIGEDITECEIIKCTYLRFRPPTVESKCNSKRRNDLYSRDLAMARYVSAVKLRLRAAAPAASRATRKFYPLDPLNPTPGQPLDSRPNRSGVAIIWSKDLLTAALEAQSELLLKQDQTTTLFLTTSNIDALATPRVWYFAKAMVLMDLSALGSGNDTNGRIEKSDVEAYLEIAKNTSATRTGPPVHLPASGSTEQ
ncbi:hypothetical protein BKA70DRAFT_1472856 [Coprinopsis sp. MPI-PUGE-AT-0042]|nr:hypothetical protein BKA70DRAFT_1472856 [Coprinopsis sp. MPI-PUGE-AT-0042]